MTLGRPTFFVLLLAAAWTFGTGPASGAERLTAPLPILDTHAHVVRNSRGESPVVVARQALAIMDELGVSQTIFLPPPYPPGHPDTYGLTVLQGISLDHPGRFAIVAGGDSLNPLLQATDPDRVTPETAARFRQEALAIVRAGAVGFGELTAEHFSLDDGGHPYESTRPDHPLLLLLADLAAEHHLPIDLHMEALPRDMPFPGPRPGRPNPLQVKENISGLERLLAHNRGADIIWAHCGWDLSGERTLELMSGLLRRHPNLFMSIKLDHRGRLRNGPLTADGALKPEWLEFFRAFPERFVIGSDQFYDTGRKRITLARALVDLLPPDLAPAIAHENARRLYRRAGPASQGFSRARGDVTPGQASLHRRAVGQTAQLGLAGGEDGGGGIAQALQDGRTLDMPFHQPFDAKDVTVGRTNQ